MITYAQNFEDVMLARVFRDRKAGFYVDVGAGDPTLLSVTKWFYDQGWTGINVEPNAALFAKIEAERPRDVNLQCGIGDEAGFADFAEMPVAELSSFAEDVRAEASTAPTAIRRVPIRTLTDVLKEHAGDKPIDFLKIDVEGWERKVLLGLDLGRFRPTVLVIEATRPVTRVETRSEWQELLIAGGYAPVYFDGLNWFYLAAGNDALLPAFELPPNVFDHFVPWPLVDAREKLGRASAQAAKLRASLDSSQDLLTHYRSVVGWIAARLALAISGKQGGEPAPEMAEAATAIRNVDRAADILSSSRHSARHLAKLTWNRARRR